MKNSQTKIFLTLYAFLGVSCAVFAQNAFNMPDPTQPIIHSTMGVYSIDGCVSEHLDQIKIFGKVKSVFYDADHYIKFNSRGALEELKCTVAGLLSWTKNTYDDKGRIASSHHTTTGFVSNESTSRYVYNDSAYTRTCYHSYTVTNDKIQYDTTVAKFDRNWQMVISGQKRDVYGFIVEEGQKKIEYNYAKKLPVTIVNVNHKHQFLYNEKDQLVGIKFYMDGQLEDWLDIRYDPNGKWIRERKLAYTGVHETILSDQLITHTLDSKGNWISASVKDQVSRVTTVYNRTIEYWE
jgi:hypothetical protein